MKKHVLKTGSDQSFFYLHTVESFFQSLNLTALNELIRLSQVPKGETVIIGDTLHDLEVARALEIDAVLISHGHQCATRLRPHHEMVIEV